MFAGTSMSVLLLCLGLVISALLAFVLWFFYGRGEKIVETVEFYPPEGITPAEIGYAIDEKLEDQELLSMIYYLAEKGYLTIDVQKKKVCLKKCKDADESEPKYIKTLMDMYFPNDAKVFDTQHQPKNFIENYAQAWIEVQSLYEEKYGTVYKNETFTRRFVCFICAIVNMVILAMGMMGTEAFALAYVPAFMTTGGMLLGWKGYDNYRVRKKTGRIQIAGGAILFGIGYLLIAEMISVEEIKIPVLFLIMYAISGAAIYILSLIMANRSDKNAEIMGKIYGFRTFIQSAEYERIVKLSEENPEYYYHILPYATVLGLETIWSKHLDKLTISGMAAQKPLWYHNDDEKTLHEGKWQGELVKNYKEK